MSGVAKLVFEVPGLPRGKGRHRSFAQNGRVVHVADQTTASYEATILTFARQAMGAHGIHEPLTGALWMQVTSFHLPGNKQERAAMAKDPNKLHYYVKKPDFDNIGKVVADALNGVVYADDAIIADGRVVKRLGAMARVVVSIGELA